MKIELVCSKSLGLNVALVHIWRLYKVAAPAVQLFICSNKDFILIKAKQPKDFQVII